MELTTKSQPPLTGFPSRSRSLLVGVAVGLLISAAFTTEFAAKVVPNPLTHTWIPFSSSPSASFPSQLYIFFFRRTSAASLYSEPAEEIYVSTVDDNFPETTERYRHDTTQMQTSAKSSSPADHAIEIAFREKRMKLPRRSYDPPARLPQENESPKHSTDKSSAPAEDRTTAPANVSLSAEPSRLIKDSDERSNSTREASIASVGTKGKLLPSLSKSSKRFTGRCDLSVGRWAHDDSYPLYHPGTCPFVDEGFNCQPNGRPDTEFSRWRWTPRDCNIPRLNGTNMLERLRGKRLVFVGDSLNRNQLESLLCILRESLLNKSRIVELHGGRISKLPGAYVFKFLDYDCRVEYYTSHFLVDEEEGNSNQTFNIKLDKIDRSERRWRKANVLVFNTGHWWSPDKIGEGDNCFREGERLYRKLDVMSAYRKAIRTWGRWVDKYVDPANTRVFFRGYSPLHYIGGQWNSGGQCHNETQPIFDESFLTPYPDKMQVVDETITEMTVPVQILNVTRLSDFRKDAHPAVYGSRRQEINNYQDCSHWCLPGLPDTWNELLYFALFVES